MDFNHQVDFSRYWRPCLAYSFLKIRSTSTFVASSIIGSTMLLSIATDFSVFGVPIRYLGFVGYAITFVMAAGLLIAILRSGKLS